MQASYTHGVELIDSLRAWVMGKRRLSLLLLCDDNPDHANTILDHIAAFTELSQHKVSTFNPRDAEESSAPDFDNFDVIIIHYSLAIIFDTYLTPNFREKIRCFQGLKVQFIQDDYRWIDDITAMMRYLGIYVLFTLVPPAQIPKVWSETRLPGVRKIHTLPGYIPDRLVGLDTPPLASRPIDIGYRGRVVPYWLGKLGQEKIWIAQGVLEHVVPYGLRCNIAWREEDRIYGHDWDTFLRSCKATLGTEGGATITDFDSSLEQRVREYQTEHPHADFWEVYREILEPYEGNVLMNVITPRIFEGIAMHTALILFPGEYAGIIEPWQHYIPLEKDFSNMDAVVEKLRDTEFLRAMTERAYEDIVASGRYSYRAFIREFDQVVTQEIVALAFSRVWSKVATRLPLVEDGTAPNLPCKTVEIQNNDKNFNLLRSKANFSVLRHMNQKPLNILILYDDKSTYINATMDHLSSFSFFSRNRIFYAIATNNITCETNFSSFDSIIIHYSVRLNLSNHLSKSYAEAIEKFHGLKILFIQNEYETTEIARKWIQNLGIHVVFTCVPEKYLDDVYPARRFPHVEFVHTLKGYVPILLENYTTPKPLCRRTFLIGYRGRALPYWYGNLGREKVVIGQRMRQICEERGLFVDIDWEEEKRIYGERWFKFLEDCKATLGTESGPYIFDYYGDIKADVELAIQQNPSVTYEEIYAKYLAEHDGRIITSQISPGIFEAISLKTALVLFEGNYSGIVKPHIHYIPLKKDFSNVEEVLGHLMNDEYVEELTECAHSDIIKSGQYSYRKLINNLDDFIAQRVSRGYDVPLVSGLLGSQSALASNLHIQEWCKTHSVRSIPTNTPLRADHIRDSSPPRAQAGTAQTVNLGTTVMLDGSSSQSVDDSPLTFAWSLLSLPAGSLATLSDPTAPTPTFVADQAGVYVAQLIVRAGTLESLPALVVVTTHMALGREHLYTLRTRVLVRETLVRIKPAVATRLARCPLLFRVTRRLYWLVRAPLYPLARVLWERSRWLLHKL